MSVLHPHHRMTQDVGTEPETNELSDRILGLIGAYEVSGTLDLVDVYPQARRPSAEPVAPHHEGFVEDGMYHPSE